VLLSFFQLKNLLDPIPFLSLEAQHTLVHSDVTKALNDGFEKNRFILGEALRKFEEEYAQFSQVTYCLGVGNGFDALTIALKACNVGPGDEVIVPAHTYIATWLAISTSGATIVPVEPDDLTFNIDVREAEKFITPRTKVILPVHLYGQPCEMTTLEELSKRHGLLLIEDNAQAHGATWKGKMTGSFGMANATSFYPTKNLGALGDGGAVTTNNETVAGFVRRYRNYGFESKNFCEELGVNSRLDEIQAAVLSIKLKHLEEWNEKRRTIAAIYLERLKGAGDLQLPVTLPEARHVYHLFIVRTLWRDRLHSYLKSFQVDTMVHYPVPPHLQKAYASLGYKKGDFPITEAIASTCLSLPMWPGMTDEQVHYVCDLIKKFY
jgi:dTDP-4-amino-4,6-dideoxygalactose transaminase